jgi:cystathionine beta-synthase
MAIPHSVIDMIGNTPMLELTQFDTGPAACSSSLRIKTPAAPSKTA